MNQLTLADVQNYTQPIDFGISTYDLNQWLLTGFVQDSFHVIPDLTLDLGLRYDRQTLTDDKNDWQPRIGFGWHPGGNARTAIRGLAPPAMRAGHALLLEHLLVHLPPAANLEAPARVAQW